MLLLEIKDAITLFYKEFYNRKVISIVDCGDWFVFNYRFTSEDKSKSSFNPLIGIEKQTGKIIGFNPLVHGVGEYSKAVKNIIILEE